MTWEELKVIAANKFKELKLSDEYLKRLKFEFKEIVKQGANSYWIEAYESKTIWDENPYGLVLPWLLGLTPIDPVKSNIPHKIVYQTDFPDIDLDFLPLARKTVKDYALQKYKHVCSVGNWRTYKPASALQDVARALGKDVKVVIELTKNLPDEFDELSLDELHEFKNKLNDPDKAVRSENEREYNRYKTFFDFEEANQDIVNFAFRLVGKINAQSTHAGGIIIADRPIENIVPLSLLKDNWTSQWTEGKNTQLSKFGLVKFDVLGVKTVYYIWQACNLIKQNRNIDIDFDNMDPTGDNPYGGYEIHPDGRKLPISLNDEKSLELCNSLRVDSVFQIESSFQKSIIQKGKVKSFWDLVTYNALGRPGPMEMIPEYIARRDGKKEDWKNEDPRVTNLLKDTYNIIVFQEQLTAIWRSLANFTVPEAEAARKIISKKWKDKLPQIQKQWMDGATKNIGQEAAASWWDKMVDFGRYAFNRSHCVAYSIITFRCLYLKAHYPAEWWAAVMSECHPDKLPNYMSCAKLDGVEFGNIDVNALTHEFSVRGNQIVSGLQSVKGIGEKNSIVFTAVKGPFNNIDEMVVKTGKNKNVYERLIKLGAFDKIHNNRAGLWAWYLYKYGSGPEVKEVKDKILTKYNPNWTQEEIDEERKRMVDEFRQMYPNRRVPKKVSEFVPKKKKYIIGMNQIMELFPDYTQEEKLDIEKQLLGYYWHSPLELFVTVGHTIEDSKSTGVMEGVIQTITKRRSKKGNSFYIFKINDGIQTADVAVWSDVYNGCDRTLIKEGSGVKLNVVFDINRSSFKIGKGTILPLRKKGCTTVVKDDIDDDLNDYPLM